MKFSDNEPDEEYYGQRIASNNVSHKVNDFSHSKRDNSRYKNNWPTANKNFYTDNKHYNSNNDYYNDTDRDIRRKRIASQQKMFELVCLWLKRSIYVLCSLVIVAFGVRGYRYLLEAPFFALETIEVHGMHKATPWEIRTLGSLEQGKNLINLDLNSAAIGIKRHPWISDVRLRRILPNRIVVDVKERTPVAILSLDGLYYVDKTGNVFKKIKQGEELGFPVITGLEGHSALQSKKVGQVAILEALALLDNVTMQTKFKREQISEINIDPNMGYSVYMVHANAQLHLGWEQFDVKLERLAHLLEKERLDLAQVRRVDMDLSKWAVVTPL